MYMYLYMYMCMYMYMYTYTYMYMCMPRDGAKLVPPGPGPLIPQGGGSGVTPGYRGSAMIPRVSAMTSF